MDLTESVDITTHYNTGKTKEHSEAWNCTNCYSIWQRLVKGPGVFWADGVRLIFEPRLNYDSRKKDKKGKQEIRILLAHVFLGMTLRWRLPRQRAAAAASAICVTRWCRTQSVYSRIFASGGIQIISHRNDTPCLPIWCVIIFNTERVSVLAAGFRHTAFRHTRPWCACAAVYWNPNLIWSTWTPACSGCLLSPMVKGWLILISGSYRLRLFMLYIFCLMYANPGERM